MFKKFFLVLLISALLNICAENVQAREVVDMRGKTVIVPDNITNIATIDDGFIESVLTYLGEIDKVKVIGSWGLKRDYSYTFPKENGEEYTLKGLSTMKELHPWLNDLLCVSSPQGNAVNFEALAAAKPDVVIIRVGDCTVRSDTMEATQRTIDTIESLKIPLIVLYTPAFDKDYNLSSMKTEAEVIASLFGSKQVAQARLLMNYTESIETLIHTRLDNISENEKKRVLYFGLNPTTRDQGGAGTVHGIDTPQSFMIEKIINAKNAFQNKGTSIPVNTEQVYALDADVILLPTMNGYHPAEELYSAPYYSLLRDVRAVKNKQVYPLPWTPMYCAPRLEYPLELLIMAKAVYPEKFKDIIFHEFALDFYKKVYHIDEIQAKKLLDTQILNWTSEQGW